MGKITREEIEKQTLDLIIEHTVHNFTLVESDQIKNSIMDDDDKDINQCFSCMHEKCDFIDNIINKEFNIIIDLNCGLKFVEIEGNDNLVAESLDDDGETCEIDQYDDEHDELLCINTLDDLVDVIEKELDKK